MHFRVADKKADPGLLRILKWQALDPRATGKWILP